MKIRPLGTELFHADGQADGRRDITKLRDHLENLRINGRNIRIGLQKRYWGHVLN